MRHFEFFDRDLTLPQSATNLRFVGAFQPQFNRFFNHRFGLLRGFTLTDNAKLGTIGDVPSIVSGLDHSRKFGKFHREQFISSGRVAPIRGKKSQRVKAAADASTNH